MKRKFESEYLKLYLGKAFEISFAICGYFDNRPRITIAIFFFRLVIVLPFKNKWTDECVPPRYGISYHHQTFWVHLGGNGNMNGGDKWWTFDMPWQLKWVRTSFLKNDGEWEHETYLNRRFFHKENLNGVLWKETHPYTYKLKSGIIQNRIATIKVEEREWRMNWFKWLPINRKIRKTIDVEFNTEVGERTGSWKGGTLGCGYDLNPNETPLQCLRRMEVERTFS